MSLADLFPDLRRATRPSGCPGECCALTSGHGRRVGRFKDRGPDVVSCAANSQRKAVATPIRAYYGLSIAPGKVFAVPAAALDGTNDVRLPSNTAYIEVRSALLARHRYPGCN